MEKKEYFEIRLRQDFIRYVLLRKPRLSSNEVTKRLKKAIDVDNMIRKMKDVIRMTCETHLSIKNIMNGDGQIVNKLPDSLNPTLIDIIVEDYRTQIKKHCDTDRLIPIIKAQIERLTWLQGVDEMSEDLSQFIAEIKKLSAEYSNIPIATLYEQDLQKKYEAARRITIKERIMSDNSKDIVIFRSVLVEHAHCACETVLYHELANLFANIANASEINNIIVIFDKMHNEALTEQNSIIIPGHPTEWDDEYNRLVPVDFFERNIEDIDAAMAFHMVMLQAFARNEDTLKKELLISDCGELNIFLNENFINNNLLKQIIFENEEAR